MYVRRTADILFIVVFYMMLIQKNPICNKREKPRINTVVIPLPKTKPILLLESTTSVESKP